jgi:mRNA interferase MazF
VIARGTIVIAALRGDYGKPRPVLVVQSDVAEIRFSCVICPLTTHEHDEGSPLVRVPVAPTATNGVNRPSQIMIDKITAMSVAKLSEPVGHLDEATMGQVDRALSLLLGLV